MQKQGMKLWILVGLLSLLGGCVAPNGSMIRYQQAPDGSIVGWQVDAASSSDKVSRNGHTPRPILFMSGAEEPVIQSVNSDGSNLSIVGSGGLLGWSHLGDRYAYVSSSTDAEYGQIRIAKVGQKEETQIEIELSTNYVEGYPSIWSPDDTQIAVFLIDEPASLMDVNIVDAASGQVVREFSVPYKPADEVSAWGKEFDNYMRDLAAFVSWSPNGHKLLVLLSDLTVIDIKTGVVETIVSPTTGTWYEWLPSSDGLIYADRPSDNGEVIGLPNIWRIGLEANAVPIPLLSSEQLAMLNFEEGNVYLYRVSPTGTYVALVSMMYGRDVSPQSQLMIFDLATLLAEFTNSTTLQPLAHRELPGVVGSLAWGPDEQELAFVMATMEAATVEVIAWKDGVTHTVGDLGLEAADFESGLLGILGALFSVGLTFVSWTP